MQTQEIPEAAQYGIWDEEAQEFAEWLYSDEEAEEAEEGCRRSGLAFYVRAARPDVDDSWLDDLQI